MKRGHKHSKFILLAKEIIDTCFLFYYYYRKCALQLTIKY